MMKIIDIRGLTENQKEWTEMFLLKFSNQDCWIAPWEGDPGRTLLRENAKEFKSETQARKFAAKLIKSNSFRQFSLVVEQK